MMLAAVVDRYGPPEALVIREVPTPVPGPEQVLVQIHATVVTPSDVAFRNGELWIARLFSGPFKPRLPILGDAFAGVVVSVGAGVTRFSAGDRVAGATGPALGAHAQFVVVDEAGAMIRLPSEVEFGAAAGLCDGGLVALPFLRDQARLEAGQHVLVNGASGSIGTAAVQVARAMGAVVTGVTSTRNVELVRSIGADRVIDYTAEDFTAVDAAYDVIFDTVGKSSFARCYDALKPDGIYLTPTPMLSPAMLRKSGRRARFAATGLRRPAEKAKDLVQLFDWLAAGKLRTVIEREYDFADIAAAHAHVEAGHKVGSIVVNVP
ncbi:NAD(P)-dependent alcohol dehydrogenase [Devosia sp. ZB163]|uniref:NAD(P)-dependent alcohol dehydrogenase n=1 Tax=Devosia sp. ZB163 TaxID=3025938 RepID=UPI00235DEE6E|nr:NAD(P)-dependent alcohol dehydrogenase [Devosia sp. ZB163]MDC9825923.1 NAD(P)-dependent alcohol dehydrogenase [Devosia sp. ZB163]